MIYDVEGLGLKHLWKPAIETFGEVHRADNSRPSPTCCCLAPSSNVILHPQILQMFEENYPEGLKRLFVIKGASPTVRNGCWLNNCSTSMFSFLLQPLKSFPWRTTSSSIF